ncbi:conserved hypothetical protein [Arcobacter nitrofigilis DSM 7299]|uniref:EF-hand domain-containing protein n=1 Tax=Arcobacter nitrofigilis (strain ATCC 33309 / DSM 7299 / CCUG 15893 / LMG 7604 / NCTC 12251 / CI) TaxID=572480 RepID=D5V7J3_ARCNC|nr:hypothetical protein [Arcobacter nitrofigilis]ADG94613.1 conserved hypothetical protein [Arcobacter nitrofigilis DSM 7299]
MKACKLVLGFLAVATLVSTLNATDYTQRGPSNFEEYDTNNDGFVSESEFYDLRAKKMEAKANQGMRMKNAANAPSFESFDTNGDKKLSKAELLEGQMKNMKQNMNQKGMGNKMNSGQGMNKGQGMGKGMNNSNQ